MAMMRTMFPEHVRAIWGLCRDHTDLKLEGLCKDWEVLGIGLGSFRQDMENNSPHRPAVCLQCASDLLFFGRL